MFTVGKDVVALSDIGGGVTEGCPVPRGDVEFVGLEEIGGG